MKFNLLDRNGECIANGIADLNSDGIWCGFLTTESMTEQLKSLFSDLEHIVDNQIFSVLDEVERSIAERNLTVYLEDGRKMRAVDIFLNSEMGVSWKDSCEL